MTYQQISGKVARLGAVVALSATMLLGAAAPASASTWNDGQPWWTCKNQYTYWSGAVYNGNRYMGSLTVYGCSNGFWARSSSAVGYTSVSVSLQRVTPWGFSVGSGNYAAITSGLVDKNYGSTYIAHAYIGGGIRDIRFSIYY